MAKKPKLNFYFEYVMTALPWMLPSVAKIAAANLVTVGSSNSRCVAFSCFQRKKFERGKKINLKQKFKKYQGLKKSTWNENSAFEVNFKKAPPFKKRKKGPRKKSEQKSPNADKS